MSSSESIPSVNAQPAMQAGFREVVLLALGFGCMIGYSRMLALGFVGYLSQGVLESSESWYALRSVTSLAVLALLGFAGWRRLFRIGTKTLMVGTAAAVASAIVFALDTAGAFGWAVALLGGASSALIMYAWMMLLSRFDVRTIVGVTLVGLVVSGAIIGGVPRIDPALGLVVAVAAAFMSGSSAILLDPNLESCVPDGPLGVSEAARVPWLTVIFVLLCSFLSTVLYGIAQELTWLYDWSPNYVAFGVAVIACLAATLWLIVYGKNWMHRVWAPLFAVLMLALLFSCFSLRSSIQIGVGFMLAGVFCAHFLNWVIFPAIFTTLRIPRAFMGGVILIAANGSLASGLGDALGTLLPHSMQNLGGVAGVMVIVLGVAFAAVQAGYHRAYGNAFGTVGVFSQVPADELRHASTLGREKQPSDAETSGYDEAASAGDDLAKTGRSTTQLQDEMLQALPSRQSQAAADVDAEAARVSGGVSADPLLVLQARIDAIASEYGLTPREIEVGLLTVQGFSCSYIAEKLVVSESTVRFHQKNLYKKLDVHSRNELIEFVNMR